MARSTEYFPFPLSATTPPEEARQFVVARYEKLIDGSDLKIPQKSVFKKQFEALAELIDRDFIPEEQARERGETHANIPYHNMRHLCQTAHDDINVAYVLAKRNLVPAFLAYELPQNGLAHDWGYIGPLSKRMPTFAHRLPIHVENSMGKIIRLKRRADFPSFYTDEQKEMSIWGTVLATHATHFRDPATMARLLNSRARIIEKFADKFADETNREYLLAAGQWLSDGAQFGDLGGQVAQAGYMELLPGLRFELNEATPKGEPLKGNVQIGITPEEMTKKGSGFVQFFILGGRPFQTARALFGPGNAYERAWKQLIIPTP